MRLSEIDLSRYPKLETEITKLCKRITELQTRKI